jgi:hypothetical protein
MQCACILLERAWPAPVGHVGVDFACISFRAEDPSHCGTSRSILTMFEEQAVLQYSLF